MTALTKSLLTALAGTATMTLYSYGLSHKEQKQFREPELLEEMTVRALGRKKDLRSKGLLGFGLHYLAGVGFTALYHTFWNKKNRKPNWKSGSILGALSGLLGIGMWELSFKAHHNAPTVDKKDFYRQLIMAHAIFGATVGELERRISSGAG